MRSTGAFYTWTNKSTWSKIDRMVAKSQWYQEMEYTHISCIIEGLCDHTPLKLTFPDCPKRRDTFKFCEMWCSDPKFKEIVKGQCNEPIRASKKMQQVSKLLRRIRVPLKRLNSDRYADIHGQQRFARVQLEMVQKQL